MVYPIDYFHIFKNFPKIPKVLYDVSDNRIKAPDMYVEKEVAEKSQSKTQKEKAE